MKIGLNKLQQQEYRRSKKLSVHFKQRQTIVNTYAPLKAKQTAFDLHLQQLSDLASQIIYTSKGTTRQKAKLKKQTGHFYHNICSLTRSFLISTENRELAPNFKITARKITGMADGNVLATIVKINQLIQKEILPLPGFSAYGITLATLNQGLSIAQQFNNSIGAAPASNAKKTALRKAIDKQIHLLKNDILEFDLLITHFTITNPNFYYSFKAAKKIKHYGIRHNILKGTVTLGGKIQPKAEITCAEQKKSTTTNLHGEYILARTRAGLREITCTIPNHLPQTKIIKIIKGKTLQLNWEF